MSVTLMIVLGTWAIFNAWSQTMNILGRRILERGFRELEKAHETGCLGCTGTDEWVEDAQPHPGAQPATWRDEIVLVELINRRPFEADRPFETFFLHGEEFIGPRQSWTSCR